MLLHLILYAVATAEKTKTKQRCYDTHSLSSLGQLQTVPEPEETDYEDEGNYTGGTTGGSGSGTGSGFVDPTPYLKVDMKNSPRLPNIEDASPTHMTTPYYKTIHKDEVDKPSYYKMANREMNNQKYRGK